jgi:hypothetical protein
MFVMSRQMKYAFKASFLPLIIYFILPGALAQTLDTADDASMAESMDQAAQAFEKMKAQYAAASPGGYKQWAEKRAYPVDSG